MSIKRSIKRSAPLALGLALIALAVTPFHLRIGSGLMAFSMAWMLLCPCGIPVINAKPWLWIPRQIFFLGDGSNPHLHRAKSSMKTYIIIFALLCGGAWAEKNESSLSVVTTALGLYDKPDVAAAKCISFSCKGGSVTINCETGTVKISEGISLDQAAVDFWKAVAKAFPEVRESIISGVDKEPKEKLIPYKPNPHLITLEQHENMRPIISQITETRNGIACPKCGEELWDDLTRVLTSNPPQTPISCKKCGYTGSRH